MLLDCDSFNTATWTETILDPDSSWVGSITGGDGSFSANLTGSPGHQGLLYRYDSSIIRCSFDYNATVEIDYSINLTDVGGGSNAEAQWQVWRNGVFVIPTTNKVAPNGGNLTESGTLSSGPFTMVANTDYTFRVDYTFLAIGVGTSSVVSGVIRFRPLTPP